MIFSNLDKFLSKASYVISIESSLITGKLSSARKDWLKNIPLNSSTFFHSRIALKHILVCKFYPAFQIIIITCIVHCTSWSTQTLNGILSRIEGLISWENAIWEVNILWIIQENSSSNIGNIIDKVGVDEWVLSQIWIWSLISLWFTDVHGSSLLT